MGDTMPGRRRITHNGRATIQTRRLGRRTMGDRTKSVWEPIRPGSVRSGPGGKGIMYDNALHAASRGSVSRMAPSTMVSGGWNRVRAGIGRTALGLTAVAAGATMAVTGVGVMATRFSNSVLRTLHPNSSYPMAYGSYGYRTAADAGPAGLVGLKFQFRRR